MCATSCTADWLKRPIEMLNPTTYERLRRSAQSMLRTQYRNPRWEPAELVHEAFLRLARSQTPIEFQNVRHLHAIVLLMMRRILIDSARSARGTEARSADTVDLDSMAAPIENCNAFPVRDALNRLAIRQKRTFTIVKMRFYGGFDLEEIAGELRISTRTVKRELRAGRIWLRNILEVASRA
jgi:RNA polymerase sigma-70 factor (ECF subfamily)